MSLQALFYAYFSSGKRELISVDFIDDLPFPLNLSQNVRIGIGICIVVILIGGLLLKKIIFDYLRSPETHLNPINLLIWVDQLNSLILGSLNLTFGAIAFIFPEPISKILGQGFCDWVPLFGCLNVTGSIIWRCQLAVLRILFIKAQDWVKSTVGEWPLVLSFLIVGLACQASVGFVVFLLDDDTLSAKTCSHHTEEDITIWRNYKLATGAVHVEAETRKLILRLIYAIGGLTTVIELSCYAAFFCYIYQHNNTLAIRILPEWVIKKRNQTNAISMIGQVLSWLMEIWYIVLVGILSTLVQMEHLRAVLVLVKCSEYFTVPLLQILTSAPLRRFIKAKKD